MRYAVIALVLAVSACAPQQMDALTYSHEMYIGCLRGHPPEECESQRAAFEANRGYADSVSRRAAARPPLVLQTYTPPAPILQPPPYQQPQITCTTIGGITNCY